MFVHYQIGDEIWGKNRKDKFQKSMIMHRTKGPAKSNEFSKDFHWYIDGFIYLKMDYGFLLITNSSYTPKIIYYNGTKEWAISSEKRNYFKLHRDGDLPAVEYSNGDLEYWLYGKRHRLDGPAVIIGDKQYWFKDGEFVKCIT
jgi:hypothetical protein